MTERNTSIHSSAHPGFSQVLESRVARLERRNRILTSALIGAVGVGVGAAMMAAQQATPPAAEGGAVRCKPVSITIDPTRGSGRWNSTLLAVDADGIVYSLDTSRPQSEWRRFQFSP